MELSLPVHGIAYAHVPELGGLRKPRPDSVNTGWRNLPFRGYADHMQGDSFSAALSELEAMAAERTAAVMCAEALPWRCHRSLIADALTIRGLEVRHITGTSPPSPHAMTPFARVESGRITYPSADTLPM